MGSLGSTLRTTDDPPHHGPVDDPPKHASGPLDDAIRPLHHQHFQITLQYAEVRSIDPNRRLPLARRTFPFLSVTEGKNLATPLSIRLPESYAGVHGVMCMTRAGCDRPTRIGRSPVAIDVDRNGSELPPRPRDPRVPPSSLSLPPRALSSPTSLIVHRASIQCFAFFLYCFLVAGFLEEERRVARVPARGAAPLGGVQVGREDAASDGQDCYD